MSVLDVPGAALWYQDAGGEGTPAVFLHPASGSSDSWRYQLEPFAASGVRCITYDLRGWGRSRPNVEGADPGCMSDDLQALVEHLGLDRFVLIAAAYGGFGGVDYALRWPERLLGFVLSASQGGIADPEYTRLRERVVSAPIRGLPLELRELGPSYRTRDPEGVEAWLEVAHAAGEPAVSARQRMHVEISLPMLKGLRVPTLLVAGGADLLAPPELMRRIAAHIPTQQVVTLGEAGHCVHWEQPDEWNRLVLDFLRACGLTG
jgi:pimeloyl-ACP methyl ester carboxylesterase